MNSTSRWKLFGQTGISFPGAFLAENWGKGRVSNRDPFAA
jgi:hypothetical protein